MNPIAISVAFVPTAGALKLGYWISSGEPIPFWLLWPAFKGILNWYVKKVAIRIIYPEVLKLETVSRLNVAVKLYFEGSVNVFFLSGGRTAKRKTDSVRLMRDYLLSLDIDPKRIICDRETLQTRDKILTFVDFCKQLMKSKEFYLDYVVDTTSSYNIFRSIYHFLKLAPTCLECRVYYKPAFPPFTWLCLKYEYLYNILVEPMKLIMMYCGPALEWWRKREERLRGISISIP